MKKGTHSAVVNKGGLPDRFPTHRHGAEFWASLGRAVATFGFLEEVLGKAIFSFTATRPYDASEVQAAYDAWLPKLERALSNPLGNLIDEYGKAVREHPDSTTENIDDLLVLLREAAELRNVLCHASWRRPDSAGASTPFYVNRRMMVFTNPVECEFLDRTQSGAAELACEVINTVTHMGWQFPGFGLSLIHI